MHPVPVRPEETRARLIEHLRAIGYYQGCFSAPGCYVTDDASNNLTVWARYPDANRSTINCQMKQYAEVFVDGLSIGTKRIATKLTLQPGKHEIVFKNPKFGDRTMNIVIKSGRETPFSSR